MSFFIGFVAFSDERKEEPRQEWQASDQIGDWGSNQFDKWDEKATEGKKSHRGPGTRGDRTRNNYQGNRNRTNRDRDSTNNYFNKDQNGYRGGDYQPRETRDYHPRGERPSDANGGGQGYGGYRRGGAARGPRPDRPDRSGTGKNPPSNKK